MLEFQSEIFKELSPCHEEGDDTLLVMAKGLGLPEVLFNMFQIYMAPQCLIFVINYNEDDLQQFQEFYVSQSPSESVETLNSHFLIIPPDMASSDRALKYQAGGLIAVSSRALMMDLLLDKIPIWLITGIIILNAHGVLENSNEAFIVYLFRQKYQELSLQRSMMTLPEDGDIENEFKQVDSRPKSGFIKAFSDEPEKFVNVFDLDSTSVSASSFNFLEKKCKFLGVSRVLLYPRQGFNICGPFFLTFCCRFHISVKESLIPSDGIELKEIKPDLTSKMAGIQTSLLMMIDSCVNEIIRLNPSLSLESDLEFSPVVINEAQSYSFSSKPQQKTNPRHVALQSSSLMLDVQVRQILEPFYDKLSYKTRALLRDLTALRKNLQYLLVMDPIEYCIWCQDWLDSLRLLYPNNPPGWLFGNARASEILFSLAKERTSNASNLVQTKEKKPASAHDILEKDLVEENPKWNCVLQVLQSIKKLESSGVPPRVLLLVDKDSTSSQLKGLFNVGPAKMSLRLLQQYKKWLERRSTKNKAEIIKRKLARSNDVPFRPSKRPSVGATITCNEPSRNAATIVEDEYIQTNLFENIFAGVPLEEESLDTESEQFAYLFKQLGGQIEIKLCSLSSVSSSTNSLDSMLDAFNPTDIILYSCNLSTIRIIERFSCRLFKLNSSARLSVHMIMYKDSIEEQKYLVEIRKEKVAFEKLVNAKSRMPKFLDFGIPLYLKPASAVDSDLKSDPENLILIDMREFRSSLPFYLYKNSCWSKSHSTATSSSSAIAMSIMPLTLTVGDYVLAPTISIERKTISDLIGSFINGRLFTQVSKMSLYYSKPILLIELADSKRPLALQVLDHSPLDSTTSSSTSNPQSSSSSYNDLISKMVSLLLSFKSLRLLWSLSNQHTLQYFEDLKLLVDPANPDPVQASSVGSASSSSSSHHHHHQTVLNPTCKLLLESIVPLKATFLSDIAANYGSIKDLVNAPKSHLSSIIGENDADSVCGFLCRTIS